MISASERWDRLKELLTRQESDEVASIISAAKAGKSSEHSAYRLSVFSDILSYMRNLERNSVEDLPTAPVYEPY